MRSTQLDVEHMIELRKTGLSYSAIGRLVGKDHTTVMYHFRRRGLQGMLVTRFRRGPPEIFTSPPRKTLPEPKYAALIEEPTNPGKSYKEYLAQSLSRPVEKRYYKIFYETSVTAPEARKKRGSIDRLSSLLAEEELPRERSHRNKGNDFLFDT